MLYNGNSSFTVHNTVETSSDTIKKFARGEALFCARDINGTQYLRDMEDEFGIVPFPKWDAAQEGYYTHVDGHSPLMCIPLTISDPEFVGTIIEALSAETYREVTPVILEVVLQSKYTRDEISYEMIELALKGRQYTFAYVYDDWKGLQWSFDNLMQNKSTDFVSYYEKNESAALAQIDKVMNAYLSID